jgi:hypothetical protein
MPIIVSHGPKAAEGVAATGAAFRDAQQEQVLINAKLEALQVEADLEQRANQRAEEIHTANMATEDARRRGAELQAAGVDPFQTAMADKSPQHAQVYNDLYVGSPAEAERFAKDEMYKDRLLEEQQQDEAMVSEVQGMMANGAIEEQFGQTLLDQWGGGLLTRSAMASAIRTGVKHMGRVQQIQEDWARDEQLYRLAMSGREHVPPEAWEQYMFHKAKVLSGSTDVDSEIERAKFFMAMNPGAAEAAMAERAAMEMKQHLLPTQDPQRVPTVREEAKPAAKKGKTSQKKDIGVKVKRTPIQELAQLKIGGASIEELADKAEKLGLTLGADLWAQIQEAEVEEQRLIEMERQATAAMRQGG